MRAGWASFVLKCARQRCISSSKVIEHDKQTKYILCTQYNSYRAHEQSQINVTLPASASAGVAFQIQPGLTSRDAGVLQHVEIVALVCCQITLLPAQIITFFLEILFQNIYLL